MYKLMCLYFQQNYYIVDIKHAKEKNLNSANIDRLLLDHKRIDSMIKSIEEVVTLPDPIGEKIEEWTRPNRLNISCDRIPLLHHSDLFFLELLLNYLNKIDAEDPVEDIFYRNG